MKTKLSTDPLPTQWKSIPGFGKHIRQAFDIRITRRARIYLKLLIFDDLKSMQAFWEFLKPGYNLGQTCRGVVTALTREIYRYRIHPRHGRIPDHYFLVDPRYYAVMGLLKDHLTTEVICHESVHAAFRYAERSSKKWDVDGLSEEQVCYPAGAIMKQIVNATRNSGYNL